MMLAAFIAWTTAGAKCVAAGPVEEPADPLHVRWPEFREIDLPMGGDGSTWYDLIVPAEIFGRAREDSGDLRLFDAAGKELQYALRVRKSEYSQEPINASEFNRSTTDDDTSELTLDLGAEPAEHNEVELELPGEGFRRHAVLEASDDAREWRKLEEKNVFYFRSGDHELHDLRLAYPPSRFRYLRIRVERDTNVDRDPVNISAATVRRRVELPGEFLTVELAPGPREPVRAARGPGSAWMLDLGVDHLPCERLELEAGNEEFARDYLIEAGGPPDSDRGFVQIAQGQWSRKRGEPSRPLVAEFPEVRCARLRLVVTDYSNPPLELQGCRVSGAARQIVFARSESSQGPLRLFYGNLKAEPPHYDLERNLPAQLTPDPVRLSVGPPQSNPNYVPEPKPFTERWPWLIDVVLASAGVALAAIIVSLGRRAIAHADAQEASTNEVANTDECAVARGSGN
jgi:hypothetical protein